MYCKTLRVVEDPRRVKKPLLLIYIDKKYYFSGLKTIEGLGEVILKRKVIHKQKK